MKILKPITKIIFALALLPVSQQIIFGVSLSFKAQAEEIDISRTRSSLEALEASILSSKALPLVPTAINDQHESS